MSKRQWTQRRVPVYRPSADDTELLVKPCPPDKSTCPICGAKSTVAHAGKQMSDTGEWEQATEDQTWYQHITSGIGKDRRGSIECGSCNFRATWD